MLVTILLAGGAAAAPADRDGQRVYRWTDESGAVHYGDRVPAQYAGQDRDILNEQAVRVGSEIVTPSPEARAAAREAEREAVRAALERQRDETLLDTYLSVAEIEALRDQRMEMLDAQIRITEMYLDSLRDKLVRLQREASRFRPYSQDPDAPPLQESLAREMSETLESIELYEKNMADARDRQNEVVAKFAADIDRFRTLKGVDD